MSGNDAEKLVDRIDFEKGKGFVPAIIQDASSNKVLMQGYMNREALILTLLSGKTHFWSRTKNRMWMKGEESGHFSIVQNLILDCDNDAVLIKVQQVGPCCHTNIESCFHNPVLPDAETYPDSATLNKIYATIEERIRSGGRESYVKNLVNEGESAILRKVGEEATEVILAAKDRPHTLAAETTDLVFHLMILLASRRIPLGEIFKELAERHSAKTSR